MVLTIYHDVNVCYYGRTMINFYKTQNSQKNTISPNKKEVVAIFTDVTNFDNEQIYLHPTTVNLIKCAFLRDKNS